MGAAATFAVAFWAQAHDTWLLEDVGARSASRVALQLTSGERFARAETSIKPERVATANCRSGAAMADLPDRRSEAKSLRIGGTLPAAALWQCAVTLTPRPIELSRAKVDEYLADIHATSQVRRQWRQLARQNGGQWREVYRKVAKTYVDLAGSGTQATSEPFGLPLEIVPEGDPGALRAGGRLAVRVLKQGVPLAGLPIGLARDGSAAERFVRTDGAGRAEFALPRVGVYLLHATELRRVERSDADWESDFTTLTLRVGRAR